MESSPGLERQWVLPNLVRSLHSSLASPADRDRLTLKKKIPVVLPGLFRSYLTTHFAPQGCLSATNSSDLISGGICSEGAPEIQVRPPAPAPFLPPLLTRSNLTQQWTISCETCEADGSGATFCTLVAGADALCATHFSADTNATVVLLPCLDFDGRTVSPLFFWIDAVEVATELWMYSTRNHGISRRRVREAEGRFPTTWRGWDEERRREGRTFYRTYCT